MEITSDQHGWSTTGGGPSRATALKETTVYEGSDQHVYEGLKQAEMGARSFGYLEQILTGSASR